MYCPWPTEETQINQFSRHTVYFRSNKRKTMKDEPPRENLWEKHMWALKLCFITVFFRKSRSLENLYKESEYKAYQLLYVLMNHISKQSTAI